MTRAAALRLLLAILLLAGVVAAAIALPVREMLGDLLTWIQDLGVLGGLVFVLIYGAWAVVMLPGSIMTLSAGFAFGLVWGTIVASLGSTLGAALGFLVGRFLAREAVARRIEDYPRFHAIDRALGSGGVRTIALIRLSPLVPYNVANYAFGLTEVRFWHFVLGSWIGMLPGTVMYVSFGAAAGSLARIAAGEATGGTEQQIMLAVGIVATIIVTALITRRANREFKAMTEGREREGAAEVGEENAAT